MDIGHALAYLTTLEAALEVSSIVLGGEDVAIDPLRAKRVYDFTPEPKHVLEAPCWVNSWTMPQQDQRGMGSGRLTYTVNVQFYVAEGIVETTRRIAIATAMHTALLTALRQDVRLGSTVSWHEFRGGDPTAGILTRGDRSYIGLDEYLDLVMWEKVTFRQA